jgi:putative ABC transport system permease protein
MWILRLAWKNLWRNRGRTLSTVSAVAFATLFSIITGSLKEGVFNNLIKNIVSSYTGHLQVHLEGYHDEQILDNSFRKTSQLESIMLNTPGVKAIAARLESFALASSGVITKGCMVMGIEPERENQITSVKEKLVQGNYLSENDSGVLIGAGLAKKMNLGINDELVMIGQGYHGSSAAGKMPVRGIVKMGSPQLNERILFMSLPAAQELFGADSLLSSIVVLLDDNADLSLSAVMIRSSIGPQYEVKTWEDIMPEIKQHIETDTNNMRYVQYILYLLISFGIFSTLLIMMVERRFETGMLLALGMSKLRIQWLMMTESLFTVMLGSITGILISIPPVLYFEKQPIRLAGETAKAYEKFGFEPIFPASADPNIFLGQGMVVFVIGLILSLYPLYVVMRMQPVAAMKK